MQGAQRLYPELGPYLDYSVMSVSEYLVCRQCRCTKRINNSCIFYKGQLRWVGTGRGPTVAVGQVRLRRRDKAGKCYTIAR